MPSLISSITFGAVRTKRDFVADTVLTGKVLPRFSATDLLSVSNAIKVNIKWLKTDQKVTKEEVERAIIEAKVDEEEDEMLILNKK